MDPFVQHFQKQPKCLAIDFDGVLSHTNAHFVVAHNIAFPDNQVTYEEIQWYWLHRCRGWGSKSEIAEKMKVMFPTNEARYLPIQPTDGARVALAQLKSMGYRLVLVTHRNIAAKQLSERWLDKHLPNLFDALHFIGGTNEEYGAGKHFETKAGVCNMEGAILLVDDTLEAGIDCSVADPPIPVLVFGNYPWNRFVCEATDGQEAWARQKILNRDLWLENDPGQEDLPPSVRRAKDWGAVLEFIKEFEAEAEAATVDQG